MTGAYVQVSPTQDTITRLRKVLMGIDLPMQPNRELHVTLIYSPKSSPGMEFFAEKSEHLCERGPFIGVPERFEAWSDHKGRKIVVLRIRSTDLFQRHVFWKQQGLLHAYPQYNAHITITDKIENPEQLMGLDGTVELLNAMLDKETPFEFQNEALETPDPPQPKKLYGEGTQPQDVVFAAPEKSNSRGGAGGKKSSFPKLRQLKNVSDVGAPPVHYPNLEDDERESIADLGFNLHSHKRVLDGL